MKKVWSVQSDRRGRGGRESGECGIGAVRGSGFQRAKGAHRIPLLADELKAANA